MNKKYNDRNREVHLNFRWNPGIQKERREKEMRSGVRKGDRTDQVIISGVYEKENNDRDRKVCEFEFQVESRD